MAEKVAVERLHLDADNPRLTDGQELSQDALLRRLWREYAVHEIAMSIAANGYFDHEPLFVAEENNELVVVEGNRRLVAVKVLRDPALRQQLKVADFDDLSSQAIKKLAQLPVIHCSRSEIWQYIGFKHVNGPQPWQSASKAKYIAWLHNDLGISLDDIARQIGDRHKTVQRLYRGQMVLEQAEDSGVFTRDDRYFKRFAFSHLYTGLDYANIQTYLGIIPEDSFRPDPIPSDRVSNLGRLTLWLYGSRRKDIRPLIQSQNPDLRSLEEALGTADGVEALEHGRELNVALDISIGDPTLFRRNLQDAKLSLQQAQGRQTSGDSGDEETLALVIQILDLADSLRLNMESYRRGDRLLRSERHGSVS